jgi:hypothetical protein
LKKVRSNFHFDILAFAFAAAAAAAASSMGGNDGMERSNSVTFTGTTASDGVVRVILRPVRFVILERFYRRIDARTVPMVLL